MSSGRTANGYAFATAFTCASVYALATLVGTDRPLPNHTHRFSKRDGVGIGVGVSLAIVAVLFALLCFCGQFPQCGQLCCSKGGRPSKYGETRFEVEAQHSHYPNDPENNLQMQPYEPTDASGREGALHHVSELGARPAPQPRRERNHERRDRPRRDQSDRLGALAAAHGSHGRMASQETLVDRPSENRTDSEVLPETKDITD